MISASNNATRSGAFPKNPGRDPISIVETGWYTFEHHFYNAGLGVLGVDLRITALNGSPVHTWHLSDPTDIIGSTLTRNQVPDWNMLEFLGSQCAGTHGIQLCPGLERLNASITFAL